MLLTGIRANPSSSATTGFTGGTNSAILRYDTAPEVEPTSSQDTPKAQLAESSLIVSRLYTRIRRLN
jgi:iron transport multicopper oxidase